MCCAEETRLIEVLVTHNEPVLYKDLVCALGISRGDVQELASRLQALGYVAIDEDRATVAATAAAEGVLRGGTG